MNPPYTITQQILATVASISEKLGVLKASFIIESSPQLRKQNQIKTIQSSLAIEGNTLSEEQITAILEDKVVLGPPKEIKEVQNAIEVYNQLKVYDAFSVKSFLKAHADLMNGLIDTPGAFRKKGVGIVKGSKVEHLAPPAEQVKFLIEDLFKYLKSNDELILIKSCVFHYELEFIHPFIDGNGRMGRLWQTKILMSEYPIFEFIPFESLIAKQQKKYYEALSKSDKAGNSTFFIEFMLHILNQALSDLIEKSSSITLTQIQRIENFMLLNFSEFTRQDYMKTYKNLSSASASRDLAKGVELGYFQKIGDKRLTKYVKRLTKA